MLKILFGVARLPFLTLTVLCVALAATGSWYQHGSVSVGLTLLVLVMGLAAHISVNAFNEYFDFHSGLDFLTKRTPFSGGSGTLVAVPEQAQLALWLAIGSLALVTVLGLYFSALVDWRLLWLGVPGVLLIYSYTEHLNKSPLLCLLAPGVGFGGLMTLGAYWVLAGQPDALAFSLSIILLLLISNLLLLNQFPDIDADRQVGRRHLPIVLGRAKAALVFAIILLLCYLWLALAVRQGWLPVATLLGWLTLPLAIGLIRDVRRAAAHSKQSGTLLSEQDQAVADQAALQQLAPVLGRNVLLTHAIPVLVLLGLLWAGWIGG